MQRFLCTHLLLRVVTADGMQIESPPPSLVLGCCPANYYCPVCYFGAASVPHGPEGCQGWDEEPTLVNRVLSSIALYEMTMRGEAEIEAGQSIRLADLKAELGDAA